MVGKTHQKDHLAAWKNGSSKEHSGWNFEIYILKIHMDPQQWRFGRWISSSIGVIFRFHVKFQGCISWKWPGGMWNFLLGYDDPILDFRWGTGAVAISVSLRCTSQGTPNEQRDPTMPRNPRLDDTVHYASNKRLSWKLQGEQNKHQLYYI